MHTYTGHTKNTNYRLYCALYSWYFWFVLRMPVSRFRKTEIALKTSRDHLPTEDSSRLSIETSGTASRKRAARPISLLRLSLLRSPDSDFPGSFLRTDIGRGGRARSDAAQPGKARRKAPVRAHAPRHSARHDANNNENVTDTNDIHNHRNDNNSNNTEYDNDKHHNHKANNKNIITMIIIIITIIIIWHAAPRASKSRARRTCS